MKKVTWNGAGHQKDQIHIRGWEVSAPPYSPQLRKEFTKEKQKDCWVGKEPFQLGNYAFV